MPQLLELLPKPTGLSGRSHAWKPEGSLQSIRGGLPMPAVSSEVPGYAQHQAEQCKQAKTSAAAAEVVAEDKQKHTVYRNQSPAHGTKESKHLLATHPKSTQRGELVKKTTKQTARPPAVHAFQPWFVVLARPRGTVPTKLKNKNCNNAVTQSAFESSPSSSMINELSSRDAALIRKPESLS